jgi:hypothetical protein
MAYHRSLRCCIERRNQDAKSELGWDEFQAIEFRAWEHRLAFTILASWFLAETCLDWSAQFQRDPALLQEYNTDVLPALFGGQPADVVTGRHALAVALAGAGHGSRRRSPG